MLFIPILCPAAPIGHEIVEMCYPTRSRHSFLPLGTIASKEWSDGHTGLCVTQARIER
jgi:hypothetical protein